MFENRPLKNKTFSTKSNYKSYPINPVIKINGSRDTLIVKKGNQNIFTMFMLSWDGQGATSCEINHYQNPDATPKLVYEGISNNGVEIKGPFAESGSYSLSCKVTNDPEEAAFLTYVSYIVEE